MTTGMLQQLVYLEELAASGRRAVVVGAEHVSYSAVATLAHAGCDTVAMITELPRHQSYAAFHWGAIALPLLGCPHQYRVDGEARPAADIHGDRGDSRR